jgi:hypothetical protein
VLNKFNFFNNNRIYFYVIIAYSVLFYLLLTAYQNLEPYENRVKNTLLNEAISLVDDTSTNILTNIVDKNLNFVSSNIKSENLRSKNEKVLSLIDSTDINSLFVLYLAGENYFFLLDTDEKEHSELHEIFIPENTKVFSQVIKEKTKKVFIQRNVASLSFTLVKPIIQNNVTVGLLVIDYTENRLMSLLDISVKVLSYLLILLLTLVFIFIYYIIYTHYNKYKVYRNPNTNTLNRIYMVDNYEKINFKKILCSIG